MNIKFFLFLFFIVVAYAMRKNKQGGRNRKSKFLLVKLKEEDENKKTASHSSFLPDSSLKLSWLTNSVLQIKIGDKRKKIFLTPTTNIAQLNTPCLFTGEVEGDPLSKVFVSGCHNSNEMVASIASSQLPGGILDLSLVDGITKDVATDDDPRAGLDYSTGKMANDVFYPPPTLQRSRSAIPYFSGPLPPKIVLKTDIKYDNSLLKHFNNSHEKTKDWINTVVGLTQTRFYHESLTMKVELKVGTVEHVNASLKAGKKSIAYVKGKRLPQLTSYFCRDLGGGIAGVAFLGAACRTGGSAVNIVELYTRRNRDINSAKVFAHELGHNIAMQHDFHKSHKGSWCNGKGLMSYTKRPDQWSKCSNSDLINWWRKSGHTCVVGACSCPEIGSPVCGENGKEYENDCLAKCDGVEKKCDGKCPCKKRN